MKPVVKISTVFYQWEWGKEQDPRNLCFLLVMIDMLVHRNYIVGTLSHLSVTYCNMIHIMSVSLFYSVWRLCGRVAISIILMTPKSRPLEKESPIRNHHV